MSFLKKINWQYALGEILIVILGISIAFGLNNWAANRKDEAHKQRYFKNLKKDLETDIIQLDSNIYRLQQRIDHVNQIFKYVGKTNNRRDTLLPKIYELPLPIEFRPRNITYKTLINSGDFSLIDDFDFKSALQEHYLDYDHLLEVYHRQNVLVDKYMGNYFMKDLDYEALYSGDYSFMEERYFLNMASAMRQTYGLKVQVSKDGIHSCQQLLENLNQK